jgi:hypothetical protein
LPRRPFSAAGHAAASASRIYKNGHADNGAQRVRCQDCKKTLVMVPPKRAAPRYSEKDKERVIQASQERASIALDHSHLRPLLPDAKETQKRWLRGKNRGLACRRRHAGCPPAGATSSRSRLSSGALCLRRPQASSAGFGRPSAAGGARRRAGTFGARSEESLLSVQQMHALMHLVRIRDSALILSGDTRQHSGVECRRCAARS